MAGQYQMIGNKGAATPWWQLPGGQEKRDNLEKSAPKGYEYDPVQMGYGLKNADTGASLDGLSGGPMSYDQYNAANKPGATGSSTPTTPGTGTSASIAAITAPDPTAATNAAFATAKDQAGALSRASLTSLNDELGASGMVGSGAQVQGTRDIIQNGAGQLGQVSRDLAGKTADQAAAFAKLNYEGSITQRGQDISAQNAREERAQQDQQKRYEYYLRMLNQKSSY